MKISVRKGIGRGPTELSAFDQALVDAGVANFNLLYLSSVLPPNSDVVLEKDNTQPIVGDWGDKLYVVMAQMRTLQRNQEAWAGIGWIQDLKTKKGLLVEHEGHSEAEVRADIENSLKGLQENRHMQFGPINMEVVGIKCTDEPVCALVTAVFESNGWEGRKSEKSNNTSILKRLTRKSHML